MVGDGRDSGLPEGQRRLLVSELGHLLPDVLNPGDVVCELVVVVRRREWLGLLRRGLGA